MVRRHIRHCKTVLENIIISRVQFVIPALTYCPANRAFFA